MTLMQPFVSRLPNPVAAEGDPQSGGQTYWGSGFQGLGFRGSMFQGLGFRGFRLQGLGFRGFRL